MTMVAGAVVGILGATGWRGLALYPLSQAAVVPLLLAKGRGSVREYFPSWCALRVLCMPASHINVSIACMLTLAYTHAHTQQPPNQNT